MKKVFGKDYAFYYDIFYKDKNYKKECLFLKSIFDKYLKNSKLEVLDVACGTGGHANKLAKMGYRVTGIDASSYMLNRATEKAQRQTLKVKYHKMRMEDFSFNKKFDVIISMFSTIDYLTVNNKLKKFLKNVFIHLKNDSLFIFDFWNGDAVVKYYTPNKIKKIEYNNLIIERESKTEIYPTDNLCKVNYNVSVFDKIKKIKKVFRESHLLRYFFVSEMELILQECGFEILGIFPFLRLSGQLKKSDWDITVVAKRR